MGNSVGGHCPSVAFELIKYNILHPEKTAPSSSEYKKDVEKLDFLPALENICAAEHELYSSIIQCWNERRTTLEPPQSYSAVLTAYDNYTRTMMNVFPSGVEQIPSLPNQLEEPCAAMRRVTLETCLLDITYGLLQNELATTLLDGLRGEARVFSTIKEKNEHIFQLIKEKWDSLPDDKKSANDMQEIVVERVNPCPAAYQMWRSWSVY
jgi:hypothetical protein